MGRVELSGGGTASPEEDTGIGWGDRLLSGLVSGATAGKVNLVDRAQRRALDEERSSLALQKSAYHVQQQELAQIQTDYEKRIALTSSMFQLDKGLDRAKATIAQDRSAPFKLRNPVLNKALEMTGLSAASVPIKDAMRTEAEERRFGLYEKSLRNMFDSGADADTIRNATEVIARQEQYTAQERDRDTLVNKSLAMVNSGFIQDPEQQEALMAIAEHAGDRTRDWTQEESDKWATHVAEIQKVEYTKRRRADAMGEMERQVQQLQATGAPYEVVEKARKAAYEYLATPGSDPTDTFAKIRLAANGTREYKADVNGKEHTFNYDTPQGGGRDLSQLAGGDPTQMFAAIGEVYAIAEAQATEEMLKILSATGKADGMEPKEIRAMIEVDASRRTARHMRQFQWKATLRGDPIDVARETFMEFGSPESIEWMREETDVPDKDSLLLKFQGPTQEPGQASGVGKRRKEAQRQANVAAGGGAKVAPAQAQPKGSGKAKPKANPQLDSAFPAKISETDNALEILRGVEEKIGRKFADWTDEEKEQMRMLWRKGRLAGNADTPDKRRAQEAKLKHGRRVTPSGAK